MNFRSSFNQYSGKLFGTMWLEGFALLWAWKSYFSRLIRKYSLNGLSSVI